MGRKIRKKKKIRNMTGDLLFTHRNKEVRSILLMVLKFEAAFPVNKELEFKQLNKQAPCDLDFSSSQLLTILSFHLFGPRRHVWSTHAMAEAIHIWRAPCLAGSRSGGLRVCWAPSLLGSVSGGADCLRAGETDDEMGTMCVNV